MLVQHFSQTKIVVPRSLGDFLQKFLPASFFTEVRSTWEAINCLVMGSTVKFDGNDDNNVDDKERNDDHDNDTS